MAKKCPYLLVTNLDHAEVKTGYLAPLGQLMVYVVPLGFSGLLKGKKIRGKFFPTVLWDKAEGEISATKNVRKK